MYKGSESAPTMRTGTFTSSYAYAYVNTSAFFENPNQNIVAANTPEPSAALPLCAGFFLVAAALRRSRCIVWLPQSVRCMKYTIANSVSQTPLRHSAYLRRLSRWRWWAQ
jgi:hypothetical protein